MTKECPNCQSFNIYLEDKYPVRDTNPPIYIFKCNDCLEEFDVS